jgi:hypothetical protein
MTDEHEQALEAFLRIVDERLASAPLVDRRRPGRKGLIEARRATGPVDGEVAYWVARPGRAAG